MWRNLAWTMTTADAVTDDRVLRVMRLIWAVDHQLHSVSKRMEQTIGLTVPQRMTLLLIGRYPGLLAKDLAAQLHLHPGTVSGILARLERAGYLSRTPHASDARQACLNLTAKGRGVNSRRGGTFEDAVRRLLAGTPKKTLSAAEEVLTRLANELETTAGETGSRSKALRHTSHARSSR